MSYTAADAMRDAGYSEEEIEIAVDTGETEFYLNRWLDGVLPPRTTVNWGTDEYLGKDLRESSD